MILITVVAGAVGYIRPRPKKVFSLLTLGATGMALGLSVEQLVSWDEPFGGPPDGVTSSIERDIKRGFQYGTEHLRKR